MPRSGKSLQGHGGPVEACLIGAAMSLALAVTALLPQRLDAHHSAAANYDVTRTIELTGTVQQFRMRSPHSLIVIEVQNEAGEIEDWKIETHALPTLRRAGWTRDTLKPGDVITTQAFPNRRPNVRVVNAREFTRPDGTVLSGTMQGETAAATSGDSAGLGRIAGRWKAVLFKPGKYDDKDSMLPLNDAGRAVWETYDLRLSPAKICEPNNVPTIFYPPYLYDISVDDEKVVLRHELYNVTRTVPLGADAMPVEDSGRFGSGRAVIDDGELVIHTHDYLPSKWGLAMSGTPFGGAGDVPSSRQKKVVERYSVSEDGNTLVVDFTVEDPVFLAEPYSNRQTFARVASDTPIYPFECDPDSAALYDQGKQSR